MHELFCLRRDVVHAEQGQAQLHVLLLWSLTGQQPDLFLRGFECEDALVVGAGFAQEMTVKSERRAQSLPLHLADVDHDVDQPRLEAGQCGERQAATPGIRGQRGFRLRREMGPEVVSSRIEPFLLGQGRDLRLVGRGVVQFHHERGRLQETLLDFGGDRVEVRGHKMDGTQQVCSGCWGLYLPQKVGLGTCRGDSDGEQPQEHGEA